MLLQMALFDSFFFFIFIPHLLYPFICPCTVRLLPCLGYYKQCCYKRWGACIFSDFLNICPGLGLLHHMLSIFSFCFFFKEASDCLHQFTFPPTVQGCSLSFTSSLAFRPNNEFYSEVSRLQSCAAFSCHVSSATCCLEQFLSFPVFFMTLTLSKITVQSFCRTFFYWVCLMFSHD